MKKKKKKKCNYGFCKSPLGKRTGVMMVLTGVLGALTTFINSGNNFNYLGTKIQNEGAGSSLFANDMTWEAVMAITLSVALVIAGLVVFFASRKIAEE